MVPGDDCTVLDDVALDVLLAAKLLTLPMRLAARADDLTADLVPTLCLAAAVECLLLDAKWLCNVAFSDEEIQSLLRPKPGPAYKHVAERVRSELGDRAIDGQAVSNVRGKLVLDELLGIRVRVGTRSCLSCFGVGHRFPKNFSHLSFAVDLPSASIAFRRRS